jgi:hypothetical protein
MTINTNLNNIIVDYKYILTEPFLRMNDTGNFQVVDEYIAIGRRHVVRPRKKTKIEKPRNSLYLDISAASTDDYDYDINKVLF